MKVRYIGENTVSCTSGKTYVVESIEDGLYRIIDDTEDDFLFGPRFFEILEETDEHYKQMVDNLHLKCGDKVCVITDKMCSLDKGEILEIVETKGEWLEVKMRIIGYRKEEGSNEYNKKVYVYITCCYHPDLFEVVK